MIFVVADMPEHNYNFMIRLTKRPCPECGGEMTPRLVNLLYKREGHEIQAEVIGIPANVCNRCFYRIIPGKIAKYIDSLVDPLFEVDSAQEEKILPSPHIGIQFPTIERESHYYEI